MKATNPATPAVLARALPLPLSSSKAGELIFMPPGENEIEATVAGKPEKITVTVDAATAVALQADLTARLASGIRPALDYNHEGGRASGWPTAFRWMEGFGVICEVEWTPTAVAAIQAGEWRYFSPEFRYDRKTKRVLGLLPTGPLGGLVNDPAFRAMPAVQARQYDSSPTPNPTNPTQKPMKPEMLAALIAAGILTETEAAADNAAELLTTRLADLKAKPAEAAQPEPPKEDPIAARRAQVAEQQVTALRAELDTHKTAVATAAVEAAVQAGRLAPKDEAGKAWWMKNIKADPDAVKVLASLPINPALKPAHVSSTEEAAGKEPDAAFYEAVAARASVIERSTKATYQTAFAQAEAEIKATQSNNQ